MKIEKNVPIPAKSGRLTSKYPFKQMELGDSFFVATDKPIRTMTSLRACAKNAGVKATCRKVAGGVRVWRIE